MSEPVYTRREVEITLARLPASFSPKLRGMIQQLRDRLPEDPPPHHLPPEFYREIDEHFAAMAKKQREREQAAGEERCD